MKPDAGAKLLHRCKTHTTEGRSNMEYQLLNAILHGERLNEPLTWVYLAALVAVAIAGWKFGELSFNHVHRNPDAE
jgi:hypothetical protein